MKKRHRNYEVSWYLIKETPDGPVLFGLKFRPDLLNVLSNHDIEKLRYLPKRIRKGLIKTVKKSPDGCKCYLSRSRHRSLVRGHSVTPVITFIEQSVNSVHSVLKRWSDLIKETNDL